MSNYKHSFMVALRNVLLKMAAFKLNGLPQKSVMSAAYLSHGLFHKKSAALSALGAFSTILAQSPTARS